MIRIIRFQSVFLERPYQSAFLIGFNLIRIIRFQFVFFEKIISISFFHIFQLQNLNFFFNSFFLARLNQSVFLILFSLIGIIRYNLYLWKRTFQLFIIQIQANSLFLFFLLFTRNALCLWRWGFFRMKKPQRTKVAYTSSIFTEGQSIYAPMTTNILLPLSSFFSSSEMAFKN